MGSPSLVQRLSAGAVLWLRQRLELAALDLQDEAERLGVLLAALLACVLLFGFALASLVVSLVLLVETHARWAALLGVSGFFLLAGLALGLWLRHAWQTKPRLLESTLNELEQDRKVWRGE